jgi:hypothetical protein
MYIGPFLTTINLAIIQYATAHAPQILAAMKIGLAVLLVGVTLEIVRIWFGPFVRDLLVRRRIRLTQPLSRSEIEAVLGRLRLAQSRLWYLQRLYESGITPYGSWSKGYAPSFGLDASGTFLAQLEVRWLGIER